tara:strand:+ start:6289 stop:7086 length:798 start_codon:yes stop_codon:yes gene_type:complete
METIRKGYVDCSEGQIHYREAGSAENPTICFLHQTASTGAMFEKVLEIMGTQYHCYAFDSPGFGQSFQPAAIPDLRYPAKLLLEAIKGLGVSEFHLCGHHTGGCIAIEMPAIARMPINSLSIIGPVLVTQEQRQEYMKTFVKPFETEETGEFLMTAWNYLALIGAAETLDLRVREMHDHLIANKTMPMAFSAVWQQDFEAIYREVDIPLLIMCSEDDVLWPLFQRAIEVRPDADSAVVKGGDFQPDNDPESVAQALDRFIKKIDG